MELSLSERLKRVAGRQTLRLTHYGRKSGQPFEVTIWFVARGDKVYLGTANVSRQWVRNVKKNPRVVLSIGAEKFEGNARFLEDAAERDRAMAMVRRKYWVFLPMIAFAQFLAALGILKNVTGAFEVTLIDS
jgi:deazaflavin-dependent oxidoreductase (nitroreductase family)